MLKKRRLGKTSLGVSEIGLGCWQIGGLATINGITTTYGDVDENTAEKMISLSLDLGINTFDTADIYSLGNSEKRLGKSLKEHRDDVNIFTKAGFLPAFSQNENPFEKDLSYNHLIAALDRSLKRLETDHVDLFQIHTVPRSKEDFENIKKAFETIKKEGKSLYCGISIGRDYEAGLDLIQKGLVDTIQCYFSLIDFQATEKLLSFAKENGVGVIASEPISQGFLTGKYHKNHVFPDTDVRCRFPMELINTLVEKSEKFEFLINESRSLNQIALAYVLEHDSVSTCIPGAKNIEQLKQNVDSHNINLNPKEIQQIIEIQETF